MRRLLLICFLASPFSLIAQNNVSKEAEKKSAKDTAKEFKAGEYTMKQYYFVMLTKGTRRGEITDTSIINKLQAGHIKNLERLAALGKIVVAGPFGDDGNWRGIFIFNCPTQEEVEELLKLTLQLQPEDLVMKFIRGGLRRTQCLNNEITNS